MNCDEVFMVKSYFPKENLRRGLFDLDSGTLVPALRSDHFISRTDIVYQSKEPDIRMDSMEDDEKTGKIKIPLNDEYWTHRVIEISRRFKELRKLISKSNVRFYGNKMVIENEADVIKKIADLMYNELPDIEIKETDRDKIFKERLDVEVKPTEDEENSTDD